jgi:hypothetical protein
MFQDHVLQSPASPGWSSGAGRSEGPPLQAAAAAALHSKQVELALKLETFNG